MNWDAIAADFDAHMWIYLAMPLMAAIIGYVTKVLAVEMMFRPLEFVGIKPFLGWQGVIPRKAHKMASTASDLLVDRLLKMDELLARLDPKRLVKEIEQPFMRATEELVRDVGERYMPGFWLSLPEFARKRVIKSMQAEVPGMVVEMWADVTKDFRRYFDVRHLLVSNLVKDKELLNNVFKKVGGKEFNFFRNAGFWFGLGLGVVQLACWMTWHEPWLMPVFGGIVGFTSDWTALQMLFRPLRPIKIGPFTIQGKFIARQKEVARDYASVIAKELLTPANFIEELLRGPASDRMMALIHKHISSAMEGSSSRHLVLYAVGSKQYEDLRKFIVGRVVEILPEASRHAEKYAMDALDINNTIVSRMDLLTPEEFESMLRPAFKEDEMTLVMAGAILGALIGELQVHFML
ncbi:MAG: DUF445 family protein [Panacagrimonas sp.]